MLLSYYSHYLIIVDANQCYYVVYLRILSSALPVETLGKSKLFGGHAFKILWPLTLYFILIHYILCADLNF